MINRYVEGKVSVITPIYNAEKYLKSTFITSLAPRLRVYDNGNGIKKMRKKVKTKPSKSRNLKRYQ